MTGLRAPIMLRYLLFLAAAICMALSMASLSWGRKAQAPAGKPTEAAPASGAAAKSTAPAVEKNPAANRAQRQQPNLIPDKFTNLQLLPKDIDKATLVRTMRSYSRALGVRCNYCHVGTDDLSNADFASDAKEPKAIARAMMKMVKTINDDYVAKIESEHHMEEGDGVTCWTCHRGSVLPDTAPPPPRPQSVPPSPSYR